MYQDPTSNSEKQFYKKLIQQKKRCDGRSLTEYRKMKLQYHREYGLCTVNMGDTYVMAQVTCEVTAPRATRVNEGLFFVNVELSQMCSPDDDAEERHMDIIQLKRCLECSLKESRCIDLESLCITAGSKVWKIRLDITILNYAGNMLDSCCLAAVAALAQFRRPNVSVLGETIKIHTMEDEDPIPLSLHHMPLCVTFVCYNNGEILFLDTTLQEEYFMDGSLVLSLNHHRELCTLQLNGGVLFTKEQFIQCTRTAFKQIEVMTKLINEALEMDTNNRLKGLPGYGRAESCVSTKGLKTLMEMQRREHHDMSELKNMLAEQKLKVDEARGQSATLASAATAVALKKPVKREGDEVTPIGEGGDTTWGIETPDFMSKGAVKMNKEQIEQIENMMMDSEDEEVVILTEKDLKNKPSDMKRNGKKNRNKIPK